jgi:surface protein
MNTKYNKVTLSVIVATLLLNAGCGNSNNSQSTPSENVQTSQGQVVDSAVGGLDYVTNSGKSGKTDDNGYFTYNNSDKSITFKIGNLVVGSVDLNKTHSGKFYPADFVGVDVNNTTNDNVIKILRLLQSLDEDNNPNNGIYITNNIKGNIDTALDNNSTYKKNLLDNNISVIQNLVKTTGKKFVLERTAREHYAKTLSSEGYTPTKIPFITVWEVSGNDKNIIIPINDANATLKKEYNYTVNWGDGSVSYDLNDSATHTYNNDGNYTVKISGKFPAIYLNNDGKDIIGYYNYKGNADKLIEIKKWGDIEWQSFEKSFAGAEHLKVTATDTPNLKNVKDMSYAFADNETKIFTNDVVNDWNTSNITNMKAIFATFNDYGVQRYFNSDISDWDVSKVTDMSFMFHNATSFNQPLNDWNVSNVTDMAGMFNGASSFDQNISNWNVSNVTDMLGMFIGATSFNQPLNDWNVSNVTDMAGMFDGATSFNQPLNDWNVSKVTYMVGMFRSATSFNQPLNDWNVSNVTDMDWMFNGASSFDQNISNWDVSNVTDDYEFSNNCPIDGTSKSPF